MRGVQLALVSLLWIGLGAPAAAGAEAPAPTGDALYAEATRDLNEGRFPEAFEKFLRALAEAGEQPVARWRALLGAGLAAEKMGQLERAVEAYRAFLAAYSAQPEARGSAWDKRARAAEGQVLQIEERLLQARGALVISSRPAGARLEVDGRPVGLDGAGVTPATVFVTPGSHEVRLTLDGHRVATARVSVETGSRRTLDVPLEVAGRSARVTIRTGSPEALVFIDRARAGEGGEVVRELAAGPHTARVAVPGRAGDERSFTVVADQPLELSFEGPPPAPASEAIPAAVSAPARRPALRPLWGWLGVGTGGALLATGVAFTLLARGAHDDLVDLDGRLDDDPKLLTDRATHDRYNDLKATVSGRQIVAGVMYGLGGAAVAGSVAYLVFFADPGRGGPPPVSLSVDPRGALAATFRW